MQYATKARRPDGATDIWKQSNLPSLYARKVIGILGLAFCMIAASGLLGAPRANAENLVVNPGFETDLSGWTAVGSTISKSTSEAYAGTASAKIMRPSVYSGNIGQPGMQFEPGKTYYFSVAVKREAGAAEVGLYLNQSGVKWGSSNYPIMASGSVNTEWKLLRGMKTFPTSATDPGSGFVYDNARLFIQHSLSSEPKNEQGQYVSFYVDEVKVEPATPQTVAIAGSPSALVPLAGNAANTYSYTASMTNQMGTTEGMNGQALSWSVVGSPTGVSIHPSSGLLSVSAFASLGTITIRAESAANASAHAQFAVTLSASTPDPVPKAPAASKVTIAGQAKPGRLLAASYDYVDANGNAESGSTLGWYISETAAGAFTLIPGATSSSYTVQAADLGQYVKFGVTPRTKVEPVSGTLVYSQPLLVGEGAAPTAEQVRIAGMASVGQLLTGMYDYIDSDLDTESGTTYRWLISGSKAGPYAAIAGATGRTLTVTAAMLNQFVKFEATPADAYDTGIAYASAPSERIDSGPSSSYYVDPVVGDDDNIGTITNPFRTIQRARDKVRTLTEGMASDITVYLREGEYVQPYAIRTESLFKNDKTLSEIRSIKASTLTFDERDSGKNGFSVIYREYPGESPVISGGRTIAGWTLHDAAKNIYKAYGGGDLDTRQLYVNGVRAVRARSAGGLSAATHNETGHTTTDTFLAGWGNIRDIEMVYKQKWTSPRGKVDSITASGGVATIVMQQPGWYYLRNKGSTSATVPWYYENAYELLDEPGEWYLDRTTGMFYYKPRPGEEMGSAQVVAPELEELMRVQGSSLDQPVAHLTFSGLRFEYAAWLRPSTGNGHADAQNSHIRETGSGIGDRLMDGAVHVQQAHFITFEGNRFSRLGSIGLKTDEGTQDSRIAGNVFTDISGGAIAVGDVTSGQKETADARRLNRNNDVTNNLIRNIGVDYYSAAAISAGYPVDMDISHNEIGDVPYSGLHVGYGWASSPTSNTRNVRIQNNLIYDVMQKLNDGGNIYTLGTTGGSVAEPSVVSGNYLLRDHDVGQGAIYFDEGSNYWQTYDNVVETAPNFLHIWTTTIRDITVNRTYTNTPKLVNNGTNTPVTGTVLSENAEWPSAALTIIRNAGLQPAYRHLRPAEPIARLFLREMELESGHSAPLQIEAALSERGAAMDLSAYTIVFASSNPAVATVDSAGLVTAVGPGKTTFTATVNGVPVPVVHGVYVDDAYDGLTVTTTKPALMPRQSLALTVTSATYYGRTRPIDSVAFASDNPGVATVTAGGIVTGKAVGIANIEITAIVEGTAETYAFPVQVKLALTETMIDEPDYWYVNGTAEKTASDGLITLRTPTGLAMFQGRQYASEIIPVQMTIQDTGGWHALAFRSQQDDQPYNALTNETYLFVFSPSAIELHRFNKGERTVLYGNVAGFTPLIGNALPNTYLTYGSNHLVEFGAIDVPGGVRIVLKVDGHSVIDVVDSYSGYIKETGYVGLIARTGSIALRDYKPEAPLHVRYTSVSPNSVNLAWDPHPANVGTVTYTVYGEGNTVVGSTYGTAFTVSGLSAETGYTFRVSSTNSFGYVSDPSNAVTVTTMPMAAVWGGLARQDERPRTEYPEDGESRGQSDGNRPPEHHADYDGLSRVHDS
ncbi:Ig-like domain-containing protein [Paenibacillus hodogayensis]|uniref:Ig-like domain-containing protein n=1 Tax=Paenibacillus hodogayensis TaxID=279208 RepID=A0ABV5W611_9BACL